MPKGGGDESTHGIGVTISDAVLLVKEDILLSQLSSPSPQDTYKEYGADEHRFFSRRIRFEKGNAIRSLWPLAYKFYDLISFSDF